MLEAARTIWNKIQRVDILKAEKTDSVSHTAEDKPLSDTESPDIKTENQKPVSRKDVIAEIPKADPQPVIPPKPVMTSEMAAYPKLKKFNSQNAIIFQAEQQRGNLEIELSDLKGMEKITNKGEL
ncbi:hypothetical protein NDGK_02132 [Clostridiales bacterium CHKCI001]|nr:hypothetical protein NDGK_02132 [Clostridiales bacterium CHKCI001]